MTTWTLSFKPTFLNELWGLTTSIQKKITKKLKILERDPISADGDAKKLKDYNDLVYRVRLGDYRLFYSLGDRVVHLLSIRKRDDRTYSIDLGDTTPPTIDPAQNLPTIAQTAAPITPKTDSRTPHETEPLPAHLTIEQLDRWKIPAEYHAQLTAAATEDDLLTSGLPDRYLDRILDNLYPRDLDEIASQADYLLPDDLDALFDGKLTAFLLKLDPEQQQYCDFPTTGPVIVKGGAGTGKSTLAIYRVRALKQNGFDRILFTTYTNALVNYSRQLLTQLLGQDPATAGVTVNSVDSLIVQTYRDRYGKPKFAKHHEQLNHLREALQTAKLPGINEFTRRARRDALAQLGKTYLLEEFCDLIDGYNIATLEDYLAMPRHGRGIAIAEKNRRAIWAVYETWSDRLDQHHLTTWEKLRRRALAIIEQTNDKPFDAIVIDEAQDLSPVALRYLLALVPDRRGLYFTADASQSIYQRGFRWKQVCDDLDFRGRTILLKRNYRNTAEIIAACDRIFDDSNAADRDCLQPQPSQQHGDRPQIVLLDRDERAIDTLREFFIVAARRHRLPLHGSAILCTNNSTAERTARDLQTAGLEAIYVSGKDIDLDATQIKVLTMHSAKGLEFPFVAIVGLTSGEFPRFDDGLPDDERQALLDSQRRLFYVACSRAMRSLLVCGSRDRPSEFLTTLTAPEWTA
jgi:superfamily I DNA/RNA helicase/mRNA-degrading endonuclease RelE of RelBE toxin-antitoxin system